MRKIILLILFIFSATFVNTALAQRIEGVEKYDTTLYLRHLPAKASLYSAVLPGLGQVYNKKYWKVPIIYGGFATFIYYIAYYNKYFSAYRSAYVVKYYNDPNKVDEFVSDNLWFFKDRPKADALRIFNTYTKEEFKGGMERNRRYRDMLIMGMGLFYVLNIVDATVDAYLIDFDISKDLTLRVRPDVINSTNSLNFGLRCSIDF